MSLSASLQFRQSQSLVMTPQLMQSIKLLQYTSMELTQFIEMQIQSNPLLEMVERDGDATGVRDEDYNEPSIEPMYSAEQTPSVDGDMSQIGQMETALDVNLETVYPDGELGNQSNKDGAKDSMHQGVQGEISSAATDIDFDSFASQAPSMRDAMNEQIAIEFKSASDRWIATDLADQLDDAGYLDADLSEVSDRLGVGLDNVETILERVQKFDPPGVFARNLSECLKLQLVRRNRYDPAMEALIENLELLARRDFKSLKRICGVEEADLLDMMAEIRALDPKPGTQFELSGTQTIVPDVFVSEQTSGEWQVEMNTQTLPKVLVDQAYYATVTRDLKKSSPDYDFMNECLQSANWLSRSLDQRAKTIIKVASEIVRQQDAFFVKGVSHLKPLNLKNVAEAIGMHESTISRVTSQKYMMTPRGLFEFKYFFTVSLGSGEGSDAHSAEAIRHRIKIMIDAESTKNILSDDDIVKVLKADNVEIARRTVAKYRESMNIASSVQRRREKKLRAQSEVTKISA